MFHSEASTVVPFWDVSLVIMVSVSEVMSTACQLFVFCSDAQTSATFASIFILVSIFILARRGVYVFQGVLILGHMILLICHKKCCQSKSNDNF